MRLRNLLLAATAVSLPVLAATQQASAQPVTGLYIGGAAGWNGLERPDVEARGGYGNALNAAGISRRGGASIDSGFVGVLSLGWGFGNGFRTELEGNYRQNDADKIRGFAPLSPWNPAGGITRSYGAMVNVLYDFDLANFGMGNSWIQPYIGGGVGYVWSEYRNVRARSATTGLTARIDDTDGQFAYQGIAGLAMPLTWLGATGLTLTAEYRFLGTLEPRLNSTIAAPSGAVVSRGEVRTENLNHSVLVGLRYAFNQPEMMAAPPPPPVPAPQVARTYLVFFDWNRADLTDRARQIVADAARASRSTQTTRIEVAGHADRSGTPQYNQRLSERRAEAVAAELVRNGIGRGDIGVTAFGESRPLVPTADGVREPQNRRVEIVLK